LLKIRLRRTGAKKQPSYRVVVAESTAPRDGTFLEILGYYNPLTRPTTFQVNTERARQWLDRGALPTDRVARLLSGTGLLPPRELPTETAAPDAKASTKSDRGKAAASKSAEAKAAPVAEAQAEAAEAESSEVETQAAPAEAEAEAETEASADSSADAKT
jgi:small subunit ribosomal protein S16